METKTNIEKYLISIGGLKNGVFTDREPITSRYFISCDDGWLDLIEDLIKELIDAGWNKEITQIKEKFGGLRFYINEGSDEIFDIIRKYEEKSYIICEICGKPGKLIKNNGWYKTVCEQHENWRDL